MMTAGESVVQRCAARSGAVVGWLVWLATGGEAPGGGDGARDIAWTERASSIRNVKLFERLVVEILPATIFSHPSRSCL